MTTDASLPEYDVFLRRFLDAGYSPALMAATLPAPDRTLYLRHDIDFDCGYALATAKIELTLGIRATYYIMLTSPTYNALSHENITCIRQIRDMGHKVSLHFDPTAHEDVPAGLAKETRFFEETFDVPVDIVSIHRPSPEFVESNDPIAGIAHTYQDKYTKDIFYSSDSQGRFRFGMTSESEAFHERRSIHLLIHPVWWILQGDTPQAKLEVHVRRFMRGYLGAMETNCKTFTAADARQSLGL